ncbi:unnamed protein product [Protopolystoma xenopodis]|uniref:Uncharacterized protein n=1 Tax=Protopolystoma xenopodis TaxID=117903 RepID=A0A3S5FH00_9PLAT|nr:unnamed protein product [Protopolystoma xenopodis]
MFYTQNGVSRVEWVEGSNTLTRLTSSQQRWGFDSAARALSIRVDACKAGKLSADSYVQVPPLSIDFFVRTYRRHGVASICDIASASTERHQHRIGQHCLTVCSPRDSRPCSSFVCACVSLYLHVCLS